MKLKVLVWLLALCLLVACEQASSEEETMKVIVEPHQLLEGMDPKDDETFFIDLRDQKDYESGHITGFISMPYEEDLSLLLQYLDLKEIKRPKLYLMCYSGKRSAYAFNKLSELGYKHLNYIRFGYDEFQETIEDESLFEKGRCPCDEQ